MDWNKTKSIFIIVFSILNIFLYYLYLDRYTESANVPVLTESSVDDRLKGDNISYSEDLPEKVEDEPYISGTRKIFTKEDAPGKDIKISIKEDNLLSVNFNEPKPLPEGDAKETLEDFLEEDVYKGEEYILWEINEEEKKAVFSQVVNGKTLFHSDSGQITLYWNEDGDIIRYEQTIFEDLVQNAQEKKLISAKRAIETLYQKSALQQNTFVESADLGYSVYVAVSDNTRMFLPTWRIQATLEDGSKEEYFVNAVKDGVIEFNTEEEVSQ